MLTTSQFGGGAFRQWPGRQWWSDLRRPKVNAGLIWWAGERYLREMHAQISRSARHLKSWGIGALLCGLVVACYWPALHGSLLWDDDAHVTRLDLRNRAGLARIWSDLSATQQYYPVLHSAFWAEAQLWGDRTFYYHLVNCTLHLASCLLLVVALRRLWAIRPDFANGPPAAVAPGAEWVAAFLFAVHPVCVESVAWISEQKNTLSLVFYLAAGLTYLNFESSRRWRSYALASGFFLLALATKSVTASLPAALLLVLWWRKGPLLFKRDVAPLLAWFGAAIVAGLFTVWVERMLIGAEGADFDLSILQRLFLAGRIVWFYGGKLIWPAKLMFIYPHWNVAVNLRWSVGLVGVLGVTGGLWLLRARYRGLVVGWLFFIGSLFPALGFFNVYPFLFSYVADHFQYLASLGVIATFAGGVGVTLARLSPRRRSAGWVVCAVLVVILAARTHRQSAIYNNAETLYRATLASNPSAWLAHNNLGVELAKSVSQSDEAVRHYRAALKLKPDYAEAHNNLAVQLSMQQGGDTEAIEHCTEALRLRPDYAESHFNLANILVRLPGRLPAALGHYQAALRIKPEVAEFHFGLANALANLPARVPEAFRQYEEALRIRPKYVEAHVNFANELAKIPGRLPDALYHYDQALRINPDLAEVHYNLAVQLAALEGREGAAIVHYEAALRLNPNYAKAHNNLAVILAQKNRFEEARVHWLKALELEPDYRDARRNLDRLEAMPRR